jgi:hypothetical protein
MTQTSSRRIKGCFASFEKVHESLPKATSLNSAFGLIDKCVKRGQKAGL